MDIAKRTAELSYAERKKVGCVIVKDNRTLSMGYNGTPKDWPTNVCEVDNITKSEVTHAETNSIAKVAASTESCQGASMFLTLSPCFPCSQLIYVSGIKEVYYAEAYRDLTPLEFLEKLGVDVYYVGDTSSEADNSEQSKTQSE
jgi:dCMP deaminase